MMTQYRCPVLSVMLPRVRSISARFASIMADTLLENHQGHKIPQSTELKIHQFQSSTRIPTEMELRYILRFWHSIWHPFWRSFMFFLAFYLTYVLTFVLAFSLPCVQAQAWSTASGAGRKTGVIQRGGHEWRSEGGRSEGVAPLLKSRDPHRQKISKIVLQNEMSISMFYIQYLFHLFWWILL